jgi:hypothetical protein
MTDDPLGTLPSFDRVSIRAVLVQGDADPSAALSAAGIHDPITVPVAFGDDAAQAAATLGQGTVPHLSAVLEFEPGRRGTAAAEAVPRISASPAPEAAASMLSPAFGTQALAPISRKRR